MRSVVTIIALLGAAASLALSGAAAAHDAPIALIEAVEAHVLECNSSDGYQEGGDLLGFNWTKKLDPDPILADRIEVWTNSSDNKLADSQANLFTKDVSGFEVIQLMASRKVNGDSEYMCSTIIEKLPFMPTGRLLGTIIGEDVDTGIANSPGDYRDGSWIWDNLSDMHLRTIARYTNSYSSLEDMPKDVFYPGFYISSIYRVSAANESEQP